MAEESYERETIDRAYEAMADVFGEGYPEAATLNRKGDGFVGHFVRIDEAVDLKTGLAPVDMLVFRAITGVWHTAEGVEIARKGTVYSFALMHMTARNRIDEAAPIVTDEVIAIRRGRVFRSNVNPDNEVVAYDVVFPNRQRAENVARLTAEREAADAGNPDKAKRRTRKASNAPEPADPSEAPF
jgi:hypothetical protein